MKKIFFLLTTIGMVTIFFGTPLWAQKRLLSLQECIDLALKQNLSIRFDSLKVEQDKALIKTAFNPEKTNFSLGQDPTEGGSSGNALAVTQSIAWPGTYVQRRKMFQQQAILSEKGKTLTRSEIIREVKLNYFHYAYQNEKIKVLTYLDSIYLDFEKKAVIRAQTGENSRLEALAAKNKKEENTVLLQQALSDRMQVLLALQNLMNTTTLISLSADSLKPLTWRGIQESDGLSGNPNFGYLQQNIRLAATRVKLARSKLYPDFTFGYSQQLLIKGFNPGGIQRDYFPGTRIGGFQVGLSLPLFVGSYAAGIQSEKLELALAQLQLENKSKSLQTQWEQAVQDYEKYKHSVHYYQNSGLALAKEQIRVAQISYTKGAIGYVELIQNLSQASESQLNYLSALNQLNAAIIQLQYLQGNSVTDQ